MSNGTVKLRMSEQLLTKNNPLKELFVKPDLPTIIYLVMDNNTIKTDQDKES